MKFTIKPSGGDALCVRCKWSTVFETRRGDVQTFCQEIGYGVRVPGDITRCNTFTELGVSSERDYEKIAWLLRSDKSGKIRGFEPPKKETD